MSRVEQMAALLQDHSSDRIVNGYEPNERAWMVFMSMKKYVSWYFVVVLKAFKKVTDCQFVEADHFVAAP